MATVLDINYGTAVNGTAYNVDFYERTPHGTDAADALNPYVVTTELVQVSGGLLTVRGGDANWSLAAVSFGSFGPETDGWWDATQGCATILMTFTTGALDDISVGSLFFVQKNELNPDTPYPLRITMIDNGDDTWTLRIQGQSWAGSIDDETVTFTRAELEGIGTTVRIEWQCGTVASGFSDVATDGFIHVYWNGVLIRNLTNLDLFISDDQGGDNWANGVALGFSGLFGTVSRFTLNDTLCSASASERNLLTGSTHTVTGSDNVIAGTGGTLIAETTVLMNLDGTPRTRTISGALDVWGDFYLNGVLQAGGSGVAYAQRYIVAKTGGDFAAIQDAIDSISDASATKRYLIEVMPGKYAEQVTMQSWVDLRGASKHTVQIEFGDTGGALILASSCQVEDLLFELTATEGHWAIVGDNVSNWHIRNCDFLASVNTKRGAGIKVTGSSWNTGFIEHCIINSFTQTNHGIRLESDGADLADMTLNDVFVDTFEATTGGGILLNNILDTQLRQVFARTTAAGYDVRVTGTSNVSLNGCWLEFGTESMEVTGGTVFVADSVFDSWSNSGGTLQGVWGNPDSAALRLRGATNPILIVDGTGGNDAIVELQDDDVAKARLWWDESAPFLILQNLVASGGTVFQNSAGTWFFFNGTIDSFRILSTGTLEIPEQGSSPGTPGSGYGRLYVKTDGKLYFKNDAGTETPIT